MAGENSDLLALQSAKPSDANIPFPKAPSYEGRESPKQPDDLPAGYHKVDYGTSFTPSDDVRRNPDPKLPVGANENDIMRWDGNSWVYFPAPATTGNFFLTVQDGTMIWQSIGNC